MFSTVGLRGLILGVGMAAAALQAQITPAVMLTGTVKDAVTHTAIEGAVVTPLSNPDLAVFTDANGAFSIEISPAVGVRAAARSDRAIGFAGTELSFSTGRAGARVRVTLHDLRGGHVATLQDAVLPEGGYALSAAPASLPAGLYLVRAEVGNLVRSFKMSTVAGARSGSASPLRLTQAAGARLAKTAEGGVDWISVSKAGYLRASLEVKAYDSTQTVNLEALKAAIAPMKVFSDSNMPQIDWANATIYSWESTAILRTDSTKIGFGGSIAAMVDSSFGTATWNGWAFHVAKQASGLQPTVDLTPYAEGSLHLAVKGNAKTIGVMISSTNQGPGTAPLVDLAAKGYLPDSAWHEITIPISEFSGGGALDLSQVFVYCGFVSPSVQFGDFDPLATYMVDDIYFIPKP